MDMILKEVPRMRRCTDSRGHDFSRTRSSLNARLLASSFASFGSLLPPLLQGRMLIFSWAMLEILRTLTLG